mgnify:CR=1 FL=1
MYEKYNSVLRFFAAKNDDGSTVPFSTAQLTKLLSRRSNTPPLVFLVLLSGRYLRVAFAGLRGAHEHVVRQRRRHDLERRCEAS